jgi:hypothetical protein
VHWEHIGTQAQAQVSIANDDFSLSEHFLLIRLLDLWWDDDDDDDEADEDEDGKGNEMNGARRIDDRLRVMFHVYVEATDQINPMMVKVIRRQPWVSISMLIRDIL